ncbi:armadillo-type protein [Gongronella butleri]|nr:armadillo-type protein [Gongronella butleri]
MGKVRSKRNSRRRNRDKAEDEGAHDTQPQEHQEQQQEQQQQEHHDDNEDTYRDPIMTVQDLHDQYQFQAAHYGEVEENLVAYFKGIETKLDDQDFDSPEDQRLFVENVYSEVEGNELRLATNYSCSLILEKLLKISDHFQLRVFLDKLAGQTIPLFAHRFASHVCQTLLTLAALVVDQEVAENVSSERAKPGELPSMQQLVLDMAQDVRPMIGGLITQQFASHVVRVMLFVLSGKRVDETAGQGKGKLRTKKSSQYKTSKNDSLASAKDRKPLRVPKEFNTMFRDLTHDLAIGSSESVIRSLSGHKVASPVLQLLLEMQGKDEQGKEVQTVLLDRLLWGIVTDPKPTDESVVSNRNSWFQTLVRDTVASHLLEVVVKVAPDQVYDALYKTYFAGKMERFGMNPVANFVVQHLVTNVRTPAQLKAMISEMSPSAFKNLIVGNKYGVVRSFVEAAANIDACQKQVVDTLIQALDLAADDHKKDTIDCLMRLRTWEGWNAMTHDEKNNLRQFHIQGSLIVQAIMKMPADQNTIVINSFLSLPRQVALRWCYTPVGSRAYQAIVASDHVSEKIKKKILKDLLGDYVSLSKDKFGSHIVEACWSVADINMKEKIAQELVKYEHDLSEHHLGKCILWTCKIDLYKRRHDDWVEKEKGIERKKDMFKDILGTAPSHKKKRAYAS